MYASSVFLEEGPASFHLDLLEPLLAQGVTKVKVRVGPEWRADLETLASLRARARARRGADGRRQRDLHAPDGDGGRQEAARTRAWCGSRSRCRRAPAPASRRWRRRRPCRSPTASTSSACDEAIDAMRRGRLHVLQPDASTCGGLARGTANGGRGGGVRGAGRAARVRRTDLAGGQPPPRRHGAGDPPRRVPTDAGRGVVDVRARHRAAVRRRSSTASCPFRTARDSASSSTRTPWTATRTVRPGSASPARWVACPTVSSATDDVRDRSVR